MKSSDSENLDVVVIGGGAAGLSAALWCDELGLKTLLLESETELGGQLLRVFNPIKNYLGAEAENGRDLRDIFVKQIKARKFLIQTNCQVAEVNTNNKIVTLKNGKRFSARAIIIATGVRRKKLGILGEDEFAGRGILESGKRDKDSVKGKRALIIGGGDAALENALILSETASEITLVHRRKSFRARAEFVEKVFANSKVKILTETVVTKISGNEMVEAVESKNIKTNEIFTLPVEALLIRIGVEPNSELFCGKLKLDKNGYIKINSLCETSEKNIFAVGDVANPLAPTLSSAAGMGATAAKVIYDRLNKRL